MSIGLACFFIFQMAIGRGYRAGSMPRGRAHCSTRPKRPSTDSANTVAGRAPDNIKLTSASWSPATMGTPKPPDPIKAASVAVFISWLGGHEIQLFSQDALLPASTIRRRRRCAERDLSAVEWIQEEKFNWYHTLLTIPYAVLVMWNVFGPCMMTSCK